MYRLAAWSQDNRLLLTDNGRPFGVVDSAKRLGADVQRMCEAGSAVLEFAVRRAGERSEGFGLEDVCGKLGTDPERVRLRSAARRAAPEEEISMNFSSPAPLALGHAVDDEPRPSVSGRLGRHDPRNVEKVDGRGRSQRTREATWSESAWSVGTMPRGAL
ncbi:hypothetical protein SAT01_16720 [Sinomonas atrocyanea]|nr:hypothetical protein SAT01_16720 [Sinomonas atrocyanea]GGG57379.1 hypothetical protein GCM10007172_05320 [Sinomonas atrocyanea]